MEATLPRCVLANSTLLRNCGTFINYKVSSDRRELAQLDELSRAQSEAFSPCPFTSLRVDESFFKTQCLFWLLGPSSWISSVQLFKKHPSVYPERESQRAPEAVPIGVFLRTCFEFHFWSILVCLRVVWRLSIKIMLCARALMFSIFVKAYCDWIFRFTLQWYLLVLEPTWSCVKLLCSLILWWKPRWSQSHIYAWETVSSVYVCVFVLVILFVLPFAGNLENRVSESACCGCAGYFELIFLDAIWEQPDCAYLRCFIIFAALLV